MNNLLSVIVPVHNTERYLIDCLDSLVHQTYINLQIILIDDGSTDNSGKICDDYSQKDERVIVIHQKNQGAGAAKNVGLNIIMGEYFSLIDSDDFIDLKMFETMLRGMENKKIDIVQCCFYYYYKNCKYKNDYLFSRNHVLSSKRFLFELLYDWKYAVFWNKLFRTSLLSEIRFPVGRKIDDEFFTYKLVCNANQILNIDNTLYYYRMRGSSVMNDSDDEILIRDRIECFIERYYYVSNKFKKLSNIYYYKLACFIQLFVDKLSDIDFIVSVKKQFSCSKVPYIKRKLYSKYEVISTKSEQKNLEFYD